MKITPTKYPMFLFLVLSQFVVFSQSTTLTTSGTTTSLWSATTVSGLTFGLRNTNPYPIKITNLSTYCPATAVTYTLFYNPTLISGAPGALSTANGWIQIGSPSTITPPVIGITQIFSGLSFIIPPNTTYRMAIQTSNNGPYYYTAGSSADFFSAGGLELYTQANPLSQSYTGPVTGLTTTPRGFAGSVTFERADRGFNDASISQLISAPKFCSITQNLSVKVTNAGLNPITSVQVNWSLDGITQTPFNLSTLLDTIGHPTNKSDTNITLGTVNYTPNISRLIEVWTSMPNGVADTITSNDSLRLVLQPGLAGTYTIGGGGADFASFRAAVSKVDSFGRCGPVVFNVISGTTFTQQPVSITNLDSITFQRFGAGSNPKVYGINGIGAADAVFKISGSKNIIFDGIDVADTTLNAANPERMEFGYAVINSSATVGSSNNIIRNCRITLNRTNTPTFGIVQSTTSTAGGFNATSLAGGNHNNRYENVKIENTYKGIGLIGTAAFPDSNCIVTSTGGDTTIIGANTPNDIGNGTALVYGISAADQKNVEISKCWVRNLTSTGTSTNQGIFIDNGSTTTDYGIARVWGNTVFSINRTTSVSATGTVHGIRIDVSANASARVWNNLVYDINNTTTITTATANQMVRGISLGTSAGAGNAEFYFNTVSINSPGLNNTSVAFWKGGAGTATVRNNIFSNSSPSQTGVSKHYASYINAGSMVASNNIYWAPNANGFIGFLTSDRATLPAYAAATSTGAPTDGNEQGSAHSNPNFISSTNYGFSSPTPAANSGIPIVSPINITSDITGIIRSSTTPSIGAYETTQALFDSSAPVISNIVIVNSSNPIIRATIRDNSNAATAGNVRLWYRLGTVGAFTALAPDSVPTGSMNGVYRWSTSLSALASGQYQFYIAARDFTSQGSNISVNPIQSVTFSGFSSTDPVNYANNPDVGVNTRTFVKTNVLAGGTYSVGNSSPTYLKLTDVANALNSSEITGNVTFELQADYNGTIGETFPIVFNQLITSGGNWSVTIRPATGVTGRETSGYPAAGTPAIHLNGADRITLDGRPGGTGTTSEWTIRSKRTAGSATSPAFLLSNGAQRNALSYLKIESDNTTATTGAIFISTTVNTEGNSFNRITNNTISDRSDSTGTLATAIYSAGTTGFSNDSNIVSDNNLFNWNTSGVHVTSAANGANWSISNNHFYMTIGMNSAQTTIRFEAGAQASGVRINNNFIGGSAPNAAGSTWTNSFGGTWRGIVCAASLTDSVLIQNNTIQNINLAGLAAGTFAGIEMTGAMASIKNNTIGHPTISNSIQTSQLGTIISLWLNNANNRALIENNTIANVTSTGNTTAVGHNGIRVTTATTNTPIVIRNNTIYNLSAANPTAATNTASMVGILSLYAGTQQNIERNTIYNLTTTGNAATNVFGINVSNASGAGNIHSNLIYGLNNTSATAAAQVVGIHLDLGNAWNVFNNMVALGSNVDSLAIITGIQDKTAGTNHNISFNSVLISGNAISTGATTSHAYRRTTAANTSINNNIFQNVRLGGTANHAIANTFATPATGWRANYNALNTTNSAQLGLWNTTATDFAGWKTTSLFDTASINTPASFVSTTDLHLTAPTLGDITFSGRPIVGITTDFDGQTRHPNFPYMGADESITNPLPVDLTSFTAMAVEEHAVLNWQTASEKNNSHFVVERSIDGNLFEMIGTVKGKGNSKLVSNYSYNDFNAAQVGRTLFYRLKQVDLDGKFDYSKAVAVSFYGTTNNEIALGPNPAVSYTQLFIFGEANQTVTVEIFDMQGKKLSDQHLTLNAGENKVVLNNIDNLQNGIYHVRVIQNGKTETLKLIKQP